MALFYKCMPSCAREVLDSADIVRDRDVTPTPALLNDRLELGQIANAVEVLV